MDKYYCCWGRRFLSLGIVGILTPARCLSITCPRHFRCLLIECFVLILVLLISFVLEAEIVGNLVFLNLGFISMIQIDGKCFHDLFYPQQIYSFLSLSSFLQTLRCSHLKWSLALSSLSLKFLNFIVTGLDDTLALTQNPLNFSFSFSQAYA